MFESPYMLRGNITVSNAMHYHADKLFFSTGGVTPEGKIWDSEYMLMHKVMAENADRVYYLVDRAKIDRREKQYLFQFDQVDCVISVFLFPEETRNCFPRTEFVVVEEG